MKRALLALGLLVFGGLCPLAAQTFTTLHNFNANDDGASPTGNLIQGNDGRLYGMTNLGGADQDGVIFAINTDGTNYTTLHTFAAGIVVIAFDVLEGSASSGGPVDANDGGQPAAGLIQGSDGRLYGTTVVGGTYGEGVVFAIKTNGADFTVLYSFTGGNDGAQLGCNLVQGSDGRLYGTASSGGADNCGTVFALNTDGTGFSPIYTFTGGADGRSPSNSLILGGDGRLYGTEEYGIFALKTDGTGFTVIRNLTDETGGLLQGNDGRLYGVAAEPGNPYGSVFAVTIDGTSYTTLYTFTDNSDEGWPVGGLIQGSDGRIYGSTSSGGANSGGGLFAINTDGTGFSTLYSLISAADGSNPGSLIQGSDGRLYGMAENGGTGDWGTIYAFAFQAPAFTAYPIGQTVNAGQTVTLTAVAAGSPGYQWTFNGAAIVGATSATLTLTNVTVSATGVYAVIATNPAGSATSSSAMLTVNVAPTFTVNPVAVTIASGRSVVFSVAANGVPAPTYQWYLNTGTKIVGATDPILEVPAATSTAAGVYTCVATNAVTATTSSPATLIVVSTVSPGDLIALSARAEVGTGNDVLIGGFAVSGTGSKQLLLRGVGPALSGSLALGTWLANPQLSFFDNHSLPIVTDIGWSNGLIAGSSPVAVSPVLATASLMTSVGDDTPALAAGATDSAMVVQVPTGDFTAEVSGVGGTSGIALVEIYDADISPPTSRLVALSARANVGADGSVLIGGFAIGGTTAETVLIQAVGPGLDSTLSGTLAQPVLTIYSGATPIYSNTGWGGDARIASVEAVVSASSLNSASQDSALLVTLPPGAYTAEVSGLNSTAGIALVEIYEVL